MEPLLPALDNLPLFYTVVISAGHDRVVRLRALSSAAPAHASAGIRLAEGTRTLPLWLLTLVWTGQTVFMGVFAGGMAGSLLFILLSLGLVRYFSC